MIDVNQCQSFCSILMFVTVTVESGTLSLCISFSTLKTHMAMLSGVGFNHDRQADGEKADQNQTPGPPLRCL